MRVFLAGAVSCADSKQLAKYEIYRSNIVNMFNDVKLTVPDDIWEYRNKCIRENPDFSKLEIDRAMVDYDLGLVKQSDLIVCDLSEQSSGMGIELGVAYSNNIKVIFFYEKDAYVSNMVTGAFSGSKFIEYSNTAELESLLIKELKVLCIN